MMGIDVSGRVIILGQLEADLVGGGVSVPYGITIAGPSQKQPAQWPPPAPGAPPPPCPSGSVLFTYDAAGTPTDLPPEAQAIVDNYTPR